jgi:hypothetical protein
MAVGSNRLNEPGLGMVSPGFEMLQAGSPDLGAAAELLGRQIARWRAHQAMKLLGDGVVERPADRPLARYSGNF